MRIVVVGAMAVLMGCVSDAGVPGGDSAAPVHPAAGDLHAVGDSILAWFSEDGTSIPHVAAAARGQSVTNAARSSALMTWGEPELPAIPDQYEAGDWSWLIVDGGGNDLADRCACDACDAVLDEIATERSWWGVAGVRGAGGGFWGAGRVDGLPGVAAGRVVWVRPV